MSQDGGSGRNSFVRIAPWLAGSSALALVAGFLLSLEGRISTIEADMVTVKKQTDGGILPTAARRIDTLRERVDTLTENQLEVRRRVRAIELSRFRDSR